MLSPEVITYLQSWRPEDNVRPEVISEAAVREILNGIGRPYAEDVVQLFITTGGFARWSPNDLFQIWTLHDLEKENKEYQSFGNNSMQRRLVRRRVLISLGYFFVHSPYFIKLFHDEFEPRPGRGGPAEGQGREKLERQMECERSNAFAVRSANVFMPVVHFVDLENGENELYTSKGLDLGSPFSARKARSSFHYKFVAESVKQVCESLMKEGPSIEP